MVMMGEMEMLVMAQGGGGIDRNGMQESCGVTGTILTARAAADNNGDPYGFNRSAVLWGGSRCHLAAAVENAEHMVGLPAPTIHGEWAKNAVETTQQGYWLVDASVVASNSSRVAMLALAAASGIPYIALLGWSESSGW
jgi:hypothetical protein